MGDFFKTRRCEQAQVESTGRNETQRSMSKSVLEDRNGLKVRIRISPLHDPKSGDPHIESMFTSGFGSGYSRGFTT